MKKYTTRRGFLKTLGLTVSSMTFSRAVKGIGSNKDRPNILWIVSEDNGPFLGCYGDEFAETPNLDKLASEGILYENAFANAPVCAPSRSTIITGMYACSMGTQYMRSNNPIPGEIKFFTQYLREAGYYCTNRAKEDYNTEKPPGAWDESSQEATWKKRKSGQPFFSVINFGISHESRLHKSESTKHEPSEVKLPPYHPDTPEFRHDWAQYYDKITELDSQIGEVLNDLELQGLAEDTIVFYYSDHAGVLPRSKRFIYDSGVHVPMIIRFPKKYRHLASGEPGTRTDRLVSFVDLAPTMLSLTGIKIPDYIQGEAFLGPQTVSPREYVYFFRDRMDERYDMMRAVRDKRFKYIRNYMPHLVYAQHLSYLWRMPAMQSWQRMHDEGRLNKIQNKFFETKPIEELYDLQNDPHEVNNLADKPEYQGELERMREAGKKWITDIHDTGFLHESEMMIRSEGSTPYEMVRDRSKYDQERIILAADAANQLDPDKISQLMDFLKDDDSAVRYWGAVGCLALKDKALQTKDILMERLDDISPCVRITAAEALCRLGNTEKALDVLVKALGHENDMVRLQAANTLDYLDETARPAIDVLIAAKEDESNYVVRVMKKAVADLE